LCALDQQQTASRFHAHQDASKAHYFCGDVAYLAALLSSLGFSESYQMTMTNKIRDVELVWTLGAMLAKSAELSSEGSSPGFRGAFLLLAAAAAVWLFSTRFSKTRGYRHVSQPLPGGHESD